MKKGSLFLAVILTMLLLFSSNVNAQSKGFGLGIIIGEPTGISGKLWMSQSTACEGGVAWALGHDGKYDNNSGHLHIHLDYLWHMFNLFPIKEFSFYYGIGGRLSLHDDLGVGVRGVAGIDYFFTGVPLDAFLEVVPVLGLVPDVGFGVNAGIGLRYFF